MRVSPVPDRGAVFFLELQFEAVTVVVEKEVQLVEVVVVIAKV